jgi:hypothetical protein
MGLVMMMAPYWSCDVCEEKWFAESETGPRQCPKCRSRKWNDGMVRDADLYQKALVIRHLNPYRRPLSFRQKAVLTCIASKRQAETAQKVVMRAVLTSQMIEPVQ